MTDGQLVLAALYGCSYEADAKKALESLAKNGMVICRKKWIDERTFILEEVYIQDEDWNYDY